MSQPFDYTKPFRTKSGLKARLLVNDLKGCMPLLVALDCGEYEAVYKYPLDGKHSSERGWDLVNIPSRLTGKQWAAVYKRADGSSYMHSDHTVTSKECAQKVFYNAD